VSAFDGKVVWITGASSGIGEALAKAFAAQGAKLVLSARRVAELERVRESCGGYNAPVAIVPLDLADHDGIPARAAEAVAAFGQVDILVNNGGISQRSLAKDAGIEVDRRIMDVNFLGTVAVTKALLPHLLGRGQGRIVTVTSVVGKIGTPMRSAYAASKHALHGFFDSLRAELAGSGIGVTLVLPGFVRTSVSANALTADGRPQGPSDDAVAAGMDPDEFARRLLPAIAAGRDEVLIGGPKERFAVGLKRFLPGVYARFIARAKVT